MKIRVWVRRNRPLVAVFIILVVLLAVLFGAKLALLAHFLIGNDVVISLDTNLRHLTLKRGEEQAVQFDIGVTTNPFCEAACSFAFLDIGRGITIQEDSFRVRPGLPLSKTFNISAVQMGVGQELYRFDLDCHSVRTTLCHTSEEPTTRSILVTMDYQPNDDDAAMLSGIKERYGALAVEISMLLSRRESLRLALYELNKTVQVDDLYAQDFELGEQITAVFAGFDVFNGHWNEQNVELLDKDVIEVASDVSKMRDLLGIVNDSAATTLNIYNRFGMGLDKSRRELDSMKGSAFVHESLVAALEHEILMFTNITLAFGQRGILGMKRATIVPFVNSSHHLYVDFINQSSREAFARTLELSLAYETLCRTGGECREHLSAEELINLTSFDLRLTCGEIDTLRRFFFDSNSSVRLDYEKQDYPQTREFAGNISAKAANVRQQIIAEYVDAALNSTYRDIVEGLVLPSVQTQDYEFNLMPALILEIVRQRPEACGIVDAVLPTIPAFSFVPIELGSVEAGSANLSLSRPAPRCCVDGECSVCCEDGLCRDDPSTYPVVFLHGHAVSKDVSADYSLEGFNKIQKQMEKEGYINAGAVTLYTERDALAGVWGRTWAPLTVRASYYFDIFKEPENYIVVQAKSENIDTYAIRLRDLIETIKYKTGKGKVNVVAFSMGGLVARRYIQIFGEDSVDHLVLIGTPNKGVVGQVADFCSWLGEQLECRDLQKDSLFLNKLNRGPLPSIPVTVIAGTGCAMDGGLGDGTVLLDNAVLEGAQNYVVSGECAGSVSPLHLTLRDIDKYPSVYDYVLKGLGK